MNFTETDYTLCQQRYEKVEKDLEKIRSLVLADVPATVQAAVHSGESLVPMIYGEQTVYTVDEIQSFLATNVTTFCQRLLTSPWDRDFVQFTFDGAEPFARLGFSYFGFDVLFSRIRTGLVLNLLNHIDAKTGKGKHLLGVLGDILSFGQTLINRVFDEYSTLDGTRSARQGTARKSQQLLDVVIEMTVQINNVAYANTRMLGEIQAVSSRSSKVYELTQEVLAKIEQVASNAVDADNQSREASAAASNGEKVVDQAMTAIVQIEQAVRDVESRVEALQVENEKISATSNTIDAIAKKTNLLALNATIEAARAGEAGKGFAVVAGEVKDLSRQTAEATQGISARIVSLRGEMTGITEKMEETTTAVTQGQGTMREVTEQMQSIAHVSNDTSSRMSEISTLLEDQRQAVEQVTGDTRQIATSTKANSASLQKNLESMQSVGSSLGKQLQLLSDQDIPFKDIKIARADHAMWKKRFADLIVGSGKMSREELSSAKETRFGRWFEEAKARYADYPVLWTIEVPLNQVHQEALRTYDLHQAGEWEKAFANLQTVDSHSADVQQCMVMLLREIEAADKTNGGGGSAGNAGNSENTGSSGNAEAASDAGDEDDIELF